MNRKCGKCLSFVCLALILGAGILSGCKNSGGSSAESKEEQKKLKVVTTLFPYYDFTRQVAGEEVELSMVVPAGMDSHSFEPTPADILTIQEADVLICNGGALEHWLTEVLEAIDTDSITIMTGMDFVDTVQEEIVEGMEEEEHNHGHIHEENHGHEDSHVHESGEIHEPLLEDDHEIEIEYDEHIWTSPVNAMILVKEIGNTLMDADPQNQGHYQKRLEAYLEKLELLDGKFRQVTENEKRDTIVVGDKFPFRYLSEEYGLHYRAAFSGCSTDTEPSAKTIAYLIDKMRAEEIPVIYYLELSSHRVSEIIAEETGARPLLLHSCHNVTRQEFDRGVTYLELMEQNVINLRKGLNE